MSGHWPAAALDGDPAAERAQQLAARLAAALATDERSLTTLAKEAGLSRQSITNTAEGRVWPTIAIIFDLETALDATIWPEHAE